MKLPVYELRINEDNESFVDAIAMVESPAIESDFLAFSKEQERLLFSTNDEKMELLGAAMVPDMKIYRRDKNGSEYNVFFSKDTIRQISQVFMKRGFQTNMNLDHTTTPAKSFIFQSYIVDESKGMTSPKGLDLPDGTWVVGVKVTDPQVWNDVKSGKVKGFSVEGLFEFFEPSVNTTQSEDEVMNALKELNHYIQIIKKNRSQKK